MATGGHGEPEFVHVAHLEGLAYVGLVERFWGEDCGVPGWKRVHAVTRDGRHLVTKCIDERGYRKVVAALAEARRLAPLVVEGVEEEVREEVFVEEGGG
ncbi:MAG: hypothetical protein GXO15_00680 [Crenarchaeota archaeon]|nr:hypothetical protein [Thermoproteota archaeon]